MILLQRASNFFNGKGFDPATYRLRLGGWGNKKARFSAGKNRAGKTEKK